MKNRAGPSLPARSLAAGALVMVLAVSSRQRYLRWGATDAELDARIPGDELIGAADLVATRAITMQAPADQVWPWLAQLGQGRGGFYSYDVLENLLGCDIHSAGQIVPEWQAIAVGDQVNLYPGVGLTVVRVHEGRTLVLRGGIPSGTEPPPYDFTWAFDLTSGADGSTRLVVRERYAYGLWWARLLVEPVEAISFVMSRKMLRGIRQRSERVIAAGAGRC